MEGSVTTSILSTNLSLINFVKEYMDTLHEDLSRYQIKFLRFPEGNILEVTHPTDVPIDYIRMYLLHKYADCEFDTSLCCAMLRDSCESSLRLSLCPLSQMVVHKYKRWIINLAGLTDIIFDLDGSVCVFGDADAVSDADHLIEHMCERFLGRREINKKSENEGASILQVPQSFATGENSVSPPHSNPLYSEEEHELPIYDDGHDDTRPSLYSPRKSVRGDVYVQQQMSMQAQNTPMRQTQMSRHVTPKTHPQYHPTGGHLGGIQYQASEGFGYQIGGGTPTSTQYASSAHTNNSMHTVASHHRSMMPFKDRIFFMVRGADAPRLIGTRGSNKKRLEQITGCQIILHTESRQDGRFPVEISGPTPHSCANARAAIERFLVSGVMSCGEENITMKRRDQPKTLLQLSPKKRNCEE